MWKDVKGYEGLYKVNENGEIIGLHKGKILKGYGDRYLKVKLYDYELRTKTIPIHRIVAEAFIENKNNKPTVNHKNGNRYDNRADNLEWATLSEQQKHANTMGLNSIEKMLEKTRKPVNQYDLFGNFIKTWGSISDASRSLGIQISGISYCLSGKIKSSGGFLWRISEK